MTEAEFLELWKVERGLYAAWGAYVIAAIFNRLSTAPLSIEVEEFIKIRPVPRLKKDDSLLDKAFYRSKPYTDPYREIEDKVGIRFVVLLTTDINIIQDVIQTSDLWIPSLDRDFEAERESRPLEFTYQSKHFVLKAATDTLAADGVLIPAGTPCEVQLRTLLQHAHSELTHNNIYKRPTGSAISKKVERTVAKSMALIEAVDDYFLSAMGDLAAASEIERAALRTLSIIFSERVGYQPNTDNTNALVLQEFRDILDETLRARVIQMLDANPGIVDAIKKRYDSHYIFRQPWVLLAYLMASGAPAATARRWPLAQDDLRPIYTDLAIKLPGGL
jgi:putative GTP pyrophosphokinase